jgi:polyphosphate kinase
MHRNLDRRVEALVHVTDPAPAAELSEVLRLATTRDISAWQLQPDGSWDRRTTDESGARLPDFQALLLTRAENRAAESRADTRT